MRLLIPISLTLLLSACAQQPDLGPDLATVVDDRSLTQPALLSQVSYSSLLPLAAAVPESASKRINYGTGALQYGQLFLPANGSNTPAPLLVFVHGGCWLNAYDITHSQAFSYALAQQGYAVWSIEYRRTGDEGGGWPGSYQDIMQALRYIPYLPRKQLDLSRVVLAGHSAGGHLALLAASEVTMTPALKGVIGLAAITDVKRYSQGENGCQKATQGFFAGDLQSQAEAYQQANPVEQPIPQSTLLLHGSADSIVPIEQASDSGLPMLLVPDAGHFDWIHPQSAAYNQFLLSLNELISP
ncbi:alpha/beta hydrolase family protein [Alishewanella sp. HL-SH06]|uniref:alpha/beta hydrolase family protein n=1 Tax=Alishewanella sp. HL-SH06 TaxID=3461144 RepID=UPI0040436BA8